RLAHVLGAERLAGVSHRVVAATAGAGEVRGGEEAREANLRPTQADSDHERLDERLEQRGGVLAALGERVGGDVQDEPRDRPAGRFGLLQPAGDHLYRAAPAQAAEALVVERGEVDFSVADA